MASRTRQKEQARARRVAEEQAQAERSRRTRRLRLLGLTLAGAIVVVVAAVILSSGGGNGTPSPTSAAAKQQASAVDSLLSGIPQSGQTIGNPNAKVTVTEYGDLQCPVCRDFALGPENQLIQNDVRSGKVKLVYKSLMTATGNSPNPGIFPTQQASAYAAGNQGKAWNYILLFYHQQGQEGTNYVTPAFLDGLARQISGLNYSRWQSDSQSSALTSQVAAEHQQATAKGFNSTPTILISGPKGQAQPIVGVPPGGYGQLESTINSVS